MPAHAREKRGFIRREAMGFWKVFGCESGYHFKGSGSHGLTPAHQSDWIAGAKALVADIQAAVALAASLGMLTPAAPMATTRKL